MIWRSWCHTRLLQVAAANSSASPQCVHFASIRETCMPSSVPHDSCTAAAEVCSKSLLQTVCLLALAAVWRVNAGYLSSTVVSNLYVEGLPARHSSTHLLKGWWQVACMFVQHLVTCMALLLSAITAHLPWDELHNTCSSNRSLHTAVRLNQPRWCITPSLRT